MPQFVYRRDAVWGSYWITYDGGLNVRQFIKMLRNFGGAFRADLQLHEGESAIFSERPVDCSRWEMSSDCLRGDIEFTHRAFLEAHQRLAHACLRDGYLPGYDHRMKVKVVD